MVNGFDIKVDGASYGIKITKNSAIFAASNDYKFRQNDEEALSW